MTAHILVVDDEPEIANSLADFLANKAGYTVTKANSGEEAMEVLETVSRSPAGPVDLVVLDMRMPGISGLEVLDWLRSHPQLQYTRVVMLTAASGSQDKIDTLAAGADDYITKPYFPQELLARVQTILRTQRLEKQLATLNRVSNTITTTRDAHHIPQAAVQGVQAVLGVAWAAIYLHEQGRGLLHCQAVAGATADVTFPPVPPGRGLTGHVFATQDTVYRNHPDQDDGFRPGIDAPPDLAVENLLATPLVVRGRSVGVLSALNRRNGPFTPVDAHLFTSLAGAISRAIENASLFQKVRARQQDLQESRDRLQAVIDGILHDIYTIDADWHLVAVNQHQAGALDKTPDALVGQICYETIFGRDTPCDHCLVAQTLADGRPRRWSVQQVGEDHLPQVWDVHAYPLPGIQVDVPQAVIVWQDRTEERRLENSLLQAGKLAAIGQLAAGVAHEINNPLTAINANAQMLKMVMATDDDMYESVDLIDRAGERAAKVVQGLLDFARQKQYNFEVGDVNESLLQALRLVSYQLYSADIIVERDLAEDLPLVGASWDHVKTVWLNLLINARDALQAVPEDRRVTIVSRRAPAGDHVQVLITDNGQGMSEAERAHIFEPFYTTKDPGQGTGLGLATCQRIVQQHGGDIDVVSRPGDGTTFVVRLPVWDEQAAEDHE